MTVLYRSYRPQKWSEVVGQDHIVTALKGAIENERVAHAYLFSGSRGIGKTTVARIFADSLDTHRDDIYEIDAASNRGIDDIRELREHVATLPFHSKYKVYIVDEVHMLSKDAWNALLKTLEEPPVHVIFILATTEYDKVPETIISRCQIFIFKKPSRDILRKEVLKIAKKEGYELDAGAADLIALLGDGSFRDATGTLEKVITASKDKKISQREAEAITGAPRGQLVNDFIDALLAKNSDKAISILKETDSNGVSMVAFADLVIERARFILLLMHSPSLAENISERVSQDDFDFIKSKADAKLMNTSIMIELLKAGNDTTYAKISTLPLELAVIECK